MALRSIDQRYWRDPYVESLSATEKLVYIHLFSSAHTNLVGVFQASRRMIDFQTACPGPDVDAALERFRTFQREFFKVGSELEHCLRDAYWMPGNAMPDNLKPFANGMNYGIQSLFSATCHTMEAMERYASAHIAGEELMRRGAQ